MKEKDKFAKDLAHKAGAFTGSEMSNFSHEATKQTIQGMNSFRTKAAQVQNVDFAQSKGNLFEYIETAKFNRNAALAGSNARAYTTDSLGQPHAAADILIKEGNKTRVKVQAKVSDSMKNGRNTSAADSAFYQAGGQNGHRNKYDGMQRLIRKQENYDEQGSLLDAAKRLSKSRAESKSPHADAYKDSYKNLTDELHYKEVSSKGTTLEELKEAQRNPEKYARKIQHRQLGHEIKTTAKNMAVASAVSTGIVSGATNMFQVFKNEKKFGEALEDVGIEVTKSGIRGGVTGAGTAVIRYAGEKTQIGILADSTAATVMAAGLIDGGVALYSYAKGEITSEELQKELIDTTVKSVTTVYFTKAVEVVVGTANPFLPMAIYTVASYVVVNTRAIIENAQLNAQEYDRIRALADESTKLIEEYRYKMNQSLSSFEISTKRKMNALLNEYEHNIQSGENYDIALYALVNFANQTGIALQHANFSDFKQAMNSDEEFVLSRKRRK